MFAYSGKYEAPTPPYIDFSHFVFRWTPRVIVAGLAGYYSLGFAYDKGLMAAIDRIAIYILRHSAGYVGIGAFMPTFQWYAAWGVRMGAALSAGIVYDVAEKVVRSMYAVFHSQPGQENLLIPNATRPLVAPLPKIKKRSNSLPSTL